MAPKQIHTLIAVIVIAVTVFTGLRTAETASPAPWQAGLDLQLATIEERDTTLVDLATELRSHLGLPAAPLSVATRCDIAAAEHSHGLAGVLPEHPEAALASMITDFETHGPQVVRESLALLEERGGRVRWSPDRVDELGAVAFQTRQDLHVGTDWLIAGLADPTAVQGTIAHELEGHLRYGDYLSCRLLATALVDGDQVDKDALFQEYAYAESEIYAELKELEVHTDSNVGDDPEQDIARQVGKIRSTFPTEMAELLLDAMTARFDADETLTLRARAAFAETVTG